MANAYYIADDFTDSVFVQGQSINSLFLDDPERMRIRFERARERIRAEDKKLKKKLQRAQKYTKL
jgi:hypothetical protein